VDLALCPDRKFLAKFSGKSSKGMSDDFSFPIFDKSVSYAIQKSILPGESVKREKISAGDMSCGGITEVGGYLKRPSVELISHCALGELIHCRNHENTQD